MFHINWYGIGIIYLFTLHKFKRHMVKKNQYTEIWGNENIISKYLMTSARVGSALPELYASSSPRAEGVPTDTQRAWGSGPCLL